METNKYKKNISKLVKTWEYRTYDNDKNSEIQTNPLIIGKKFYGVSPKLKLFSMQYSICSLLKFVSFLTIS